MYVCNYVCMYVLCMYVCVYVCMYVSCICMYVRTYVTLLYIILFISAQLVPPETKLLHMKSISLHFLFDSVWTLSGAQQGKYLRIFSIDISNLSSYINYLNTSLNHVIINRHC